jgi:hypothetical protein
MSRGVVRVGLSDGERWLEFERPWECERLCDWGREVVSIINWVSGEGLGEGLSEEEASSRYAPERMRFFGSRSH